jgi:DNA-binding transcriptional ArsR family regulator
LTLPKTTTKPAKKRGVEDAVSYAVGHRIRIEMISILNESTRSADELARMIRQPLSNVGHHIKELLASGSIEIARTELVRNVNQHFYCAVEVPFFSDKEMAAKTPEERKEIYGLILQASMAEALASFWAGKIHNDPRTVMSWCWYNVDQQGREEIADELAAHIERVGEIEARALSRAAGSDEETVSIIVTTLGHERSRAVAASARRQI